MSNIMLKPNGSKKSIDDFKGTKGHTAYYDMCEKRAKERKMKSFFAIPGFRK